MCINNEILANLTSAITEINSENLQTVISKIDDENFRNLFKLMFQKHTEKDQEIIQLTNRVEDLEKRVLEQERYSSKDYPIFLQCSNCQKCRTGRRYVSGFD